MTATQQLEDEIGIILQNMPKAMHGGVDTYNKSAIEPVRDQIMEVIRSCCIIVPYAEYENK